MINKLRSYLFIILFVIGIIPAQYNLAQDAAPIPTDQATKRMTLPSGFEVTLFAGEPDIVQPIAMTFDARGRLWVVECLSYPKWSHDGQGHDRVTILEDTDHDGKHDKRTVFLDNGVNLSGIELGWGGVWLTATPNLIFVPDRNYDDIPDGQPEILLDGWDLTSQHNVFNSLTWGPDGWLYGCNGILSRSKVGAPGTPEDQRTAMDCGVWRYHPTRKEFDVVASGSTNPWGLDFDDFGQAFITNCVIKHLFHVIPGAHYDRMFGQDLNPYVYELLPSCADHIHWNGGHWTTARGGADHDDAGGGHAHSGCAIYLADQFPKEFRNSVFMCNIHGNRINRDLLRRDGASFVAEHGADFLHAHDSWFRGIAVKCAPDGSLFVTDWTDTGECHNYDVADTSNGRIYRVSYGEPTAFQEDLSKVAISRLVQLQFERNEWISRQSRRQLQERCQVLPIDTREVRKLLLQLQPSDERQAVRLAWALYAVGGLDALMSLGEDLSKLPEWVRFWVIQLAADETQPWTSEFRDEMLRQVDQATPLIQRALASTCQRRIRLGFVEDVQGVLSKLLKLTDQLEQSQADLIDTLKWYAIEPLVASQAEWVLDQLAEIPSQRVQRLVARRLIALDGGLQKLSLAWQTKQLGSWNAPSLAGVLEATAGVRRMSPPDGWDRTNSRLQTHPDTAVRELSRQLSTLFGDEESLQAYRKQLGDSDQSTDNRLLAMRVLVARQATNIQQELTELLDHDELCDDAIRALASVGGEKVPQQFLDRYPNMSIEQKQEVIYALTTRVSYAHSLLAGIESGVIPRADVSSLVIRQLEALGDPALGQRLEVVWGKVQPLSETKRQQIEEYRHEFTPELLAKADLKAGQVIYRKTCGACHKLFGEGGEIGPELTGGQRRNLDYLLDNIIDPNAVVPNDYRLVILLLDDGRILNGIIAQENSQSIKLKTATETVTVTHDRIEERRVSQVSMMPEGILDNLTSQERRDLIAFLQIDTAPKVVNKPNDDDVSDWHLLSPPWESDVVFGESVTMIQEESSGMLIGRLAFPVESIESIVSSNRSLDLTTATGLQVDLATGTFKLPAESDAPRITAEAQYRPIDSPNSYKHRTGHPDQALLYGPGRWFHDHQIEVTYRRGSADWRGPLPVFAGDQLPRTLKRLRDAKSLRIGCSGDSIAAGGDASIVSDSEPKQPAFPELIQRQLAHSYTANVELNNRAVGGWSIQNGLQDLDQLLAAKPQLVLIAYGMNDVGRRDPIWFRDRMSEFISRVQAADPEIEIVMVTPMLGHAEWVHTPREMFSKYRDELHKFVGDGVALADVGAVWQELLRNKHDLDLTGNGLNHPNDFGHRLYAQVVLKLLVK